MFLFLLPYSPLQKRLAFKNCDKSRFSLEEFEPLARSIEKDFVKDGSLAPLYRRFGGPFWESLELWVLPPGVVKYIEENSWVLTPLYGLLKPSACVPFAPVSWNSLYKGWKLIDFWKGHFKNFSERLFGGKHVVPFFGKTYMSLFDFSFAESVLSFEFYRKDMRVKNPARHHAYVLRFMAEWKLTFSDLHRINFYDYRVEEVKKEGRNLLVVMRSEGRYEL
ncbi:MAG: hypothetical protein ACK42C_02100 [Aquificaceae bacterium]|jgi:cytoplasmic iron level regulating protein YaaA (DUF328/UPF0246 family)|uniref:hypothetical protein n=1 Tax=Hydrogenobacter sp. Uz 6-8 TaxID=3384828 RepID=UPI000F2B793D|nr:MAG: peroxide stress protein YaaA [Aquificota bacterium]